ncbi:MAG: dihydrodipicolinate reductase [Sedimentitalea sp.]
MSVKVAAVVLAFCCAASGAQAEFAKVANESEFKSIISGKTLTRPLIKLEVKPNGRIQGKGARWEVTGSWRWRDGYFCRDLSWGGDDLGYNCQEVAVKDGRIRFTSDKGRGDSADFKLRGN